MAGEKEEVKFLGLKASPYTCRVKIALKLKGVEFKFLEEDLQNKSDLLLKYNPIHKKLPVLVHNEKPLAESLVIVEYIDETWKGFPILPADPYQRAQARFWSKFIDEKCLPTLGKAAWTTDEKEKEKGVAESLDVLQFLENELKAKFFGGETLGLVDIAAISVAFWVPVVQEVVGLQLLTKDRFPKLYEWSQDFVNHPVVKESLPPREVPLAFFKARLASIAASN